MDSDSRYSTASPTAPPATSSAPSPSGKRSRDPEEEVYVDNLHSHKRYLSEIMASSLNGLTVGDSLNDNLMESPSRSESSCYPREEFTVPYSPMSEDSDDARFCEIPPHTPVFSDALSSPSSPVSPHRYQRPMTGFSPGNTYPLPGCSLPAVICSHQRHRGSETEGRFPSSPNDMCHTADLRRAALLRSVQMRAQPHCPPPYELPFSSGQENMQSEEETEDRHFSCIKTAVNETGYLNVEHISGFVDDCSSVEGLSESKLAQEDKCYAEFAPERSSR